MSKETVVFLSGFVLIIVPFLGVPEEWRQYMVAGFGVLLLLVGYGLRRALYLRKLDQGNGERASDSFVETTEKLFS